MHRKSLVFQQIGGLYLKPSLGFRKFYDVHIRHPPLHTKKQEIQEMVLPEQHISIFVCHTQISSVKNRKRSKNNSKDGRIKIWIYYLPYHFAALDHFVYCSIPLPIRSDYTESQTSKAKKLFMSYLILPFPILDKSTKEFNISHSQTKPNVVLMRIFNL